MYAAVPTLMYRCFVVSYLSLLNAHANGSFAQGKIQDNKAAYTYLLYRQVYALAE